MTKPTTLHRTVIEIWTPYLTHDCELSDLAREAETGDAFCSSVTREIVSDPARFPDTDFFDDNVEDL